MATVRRFPPVAFATRVPVPVRLRVISGWLALLAAIVLVLVSPPGWPRLALVAVATIGIAGDVRLGWFGAAAVVALALPFGAAAAANPVTVRGVPIHSQDVAIVIGTLGILPRLHWPPPVRARALVAGVAVFIGLGLVAVPIGLASGNGMRDIVRDLHWWIIYLLPAVAVLACVSWKAVLRGFMVGMTIFAAIVVVTPFVPAFPGGLKDAVLVYMFGSLRMQLFNSVFLTAATIMVAWLILRRPTPARFGWIVLLATAQIMSLTRMSILAMLVGLALMVIGAWLWTLRTRRRPPPLRRVGFIAAVPVLAVALGIVFVTVGTPPNGDAGNSPSRITFSDPSSDLQAIGGSASSGGRLATYVNAFKEISVAPVLGPGMGELVHVNFASTDLRAHTLYQQPGVDDALLTVGLKAGGVGIAAFGVLVLLPLFRAPRLTGMRVWYVPAWLALMAVMIPQSFAVSGYGPFGVGLLLVLPFLVPDVSPVASPAASAAPAPPRPSRASSA